jgi:molecular chaperone GrpE
VRVSGSNEKGNFSADIAQEVINAALQSVQRRSQKSHAEGGEEGISLEVESASPPEAPAEEAPSAPASAEVAELTAALAEARKEAENLRAQLDFSQGESRKLMERLKADHERSLRAAADLENYKKRAQKEKEEVQKFGAEKLLKDILPVMDNLDRAMEAAVKTPDFASFQKGVAMTRKSFEDSLGRHGVKAFSAQGQAFDPRLHEAMSQAETHEVPPGHVAYEVLRGYHLNDRLIRPAMVVVARAPAAPPPEPVPEPAPVAAEASPVAAPEAGEVSAVSAETGKSSGGSQ